MSRSARRTHLYEFHKGRAEMALFAGFEMPMWYKGIIPEHVAVRNTVGIFDITHMGRAVITGPEAEAFLNYVTTNDVSSLAPLSAHYSTMCNEKGGIKDDFVLSRLKQEKFLIVYNATNRKKDYEWLLNNCKDYDANVEDVSDNVAMFAVQGPKAEQTLQKISEEDLSRVERFKCGWIEIAGLKCLISRTGYTGEDGVELFVWNAPLSKPDNAIKVWNTILKAGQEADIQPCGLGARDTLRLEAGMCLYGNDIDENTSPLEARLSFVVKFKKGDFIGKDALLRQKEEGVSRKRVGIRMLKRGIPRPNYEVWRNDEKVGRVTSGTFSPILKRGIAMAYVSTEHSKTGETVAVKIRDRFVDGEIIRFPFYDSTKYGYRRKT
ncbi:MAG: glycine cleavage system aminomethyltransferase GcvT [Candidatus Bathyarchaeota archaeon]|nr:glycine cleavage system aminomethyltransferase GcvT [Candidatus Bathyarchaeota archaeon]